MRVSNGNEHFSFAVAGLHRSPRLGCAAVAAPGEDADLVPAQPDRDRPLAKMS
jgi:hypothetical protein